MIVQVFHCPWSIFSVIFSKLQPGRLSISRVTFHGDWSRQRLAVLGSPHRYLGDASWSLNGRNIIGCTTGISLETVGILEALKCSRKTEKWSTRAKSLQVHCPRFTNSQTQDSLRGTKQFQKTELVALAFWFSFGHQKHSLELQDWSGYSPLAVNLRSKCQVLPGGQTHACRKRGREAELPDSNSQPTQPALKGVHLHFPCHGFLDG